MKAFIIFLLLVSLSPALTLSEREALLEKVKATKAMQHQALSEHIERYKKSRKIRTNTITIPSKDRRKKIRKRNLLR